MSRSRPVSIVATAGVSVVSTALALVGVLTGTAAASGGLVPPVPQPAGVEALPSYVPADTCDYTTKPGVAKFADLVQRTYAGTGTSGILNSCAAEGSVSEHTEGRAWDWTVSATNPAQVAQVDDLTGWLLATDSAGNQAANARRLGIMYMIWNNHILGLYDLASGWRPYSCSGVTGCHQNHVHFSFSWNGAMGRTSFWTGAVAAADYGPCPGPGQMFALPYVGPNPTRCVSGRHRAPSDPDVRALQAAAGSTAGPGSSGSAVAALQRVLGGTAADGGYGSVTADLVTTFQKRRGLPATGTVTGPTWASLVDYATGGVALPPPPPAPVPASGRLAAVSGGVLRSGQQLVAGQYVFVVQSDGNAVVYGNGRALWTTGTSGRPGARLVVQGDGNAVVYSTTDQPLWQSATSGSGAVLGLDTDGGLVLDTNAGRVWRNNAPGTDTAAPPTTLTDGQYLHSASRQYVAAEQTDGNFVVYGYGQAIWSSRTAGTGRSRLALQPDGNLVVYSGSGAPVWQSSTAGTGPGVLAMQDDGNLVLYASGRPVWWTLS